MRFNFLQDWESKKGKNCFTQRRPLRSKSPWSVFLRGSLTDMRKIPITPTDGFKAHQSIHLGPDYGRFSPFHPFLSLIKNIWNGNMQIIFFIFLYSIQFILIINPESRVQSWRSWNTERLPAKKSGFEEMEKVEADIQLSEEKEDRTQGWIDNRIYIYCVKIWKRNQE